MTVTVTMSAEEFEQFRAYQKDNKIHVKEKEEALRRVELFIKKLSFAVEPNPKKRATYKIVDQEQLDDLWILAGKCEE